MFRVGGIEEICLKEQKQPEWNLEEALKSLQILFSAMLLGGNFSKLLIFGKISSWSFDVHCYGERNVVFLNCLF